MGIGLNMTQHALKNAIAAYISKPMLIRKLLQALACVYANFMVWNFKMQFQPLKIAKSYREAIFLIDPAVYK
jgi:AmiR/NasT family two-component response regulator